MEDSDSRIAPSPEAASDDFVSPCNRQPGDRLYWRGVADGLRRAGVPVPPEVAVRAGAPPGDPSDLLAFEPVPLRYREDGLTPERQRAYVEALADTGVAREAAARVGVTEQAINRVRRRSDARSFDLACEAAHRFGARHLRSIAYQRAVEGTLKGHYYHGELISEERVHDNRLLIYLLGKTEHLLDPPKESEAVCENWEPYMDALEQGLPLLDLASPALPGADGPPSEPEDEWLGDEVSEHKGVLWTEFPPPLGFEGKEKGKYGDARYRRTLTPAEQAVIEADEEEERAEEAARRDRYFGFAGDDFSFAMEVEPYETSGDDGAPRGPIEIKSMPCDRSSPAGGPRRPAGPGRPNPDHLWPRSRRRPLQRTDRAASAPNG